jgi:hypothetical protein
MVRVLRLTVNSHCNKISIAFPIPIINYQSWFKLRRAKEKEAIGHLLHAICSSQYLQGRQIIQTVNERRIFGAEFSALRCFTIISILAVSGLISTTKVVKTGCIKST